MAASRSKEQVFSLNLLVNKEKNKVLLAEAGKDFVDVLISFLTLPLGTIARLVAKESDMEPLKVGSLSSLYESVSNLDEKCFWTDMCKEILMKPMNSMEYYCRSLKLNIDDTEPTVYYACDCHTHGGIPCRNSLFSCKHEESRVFLSTIKSKTCSCSNFLTTISPQSFKELQGFINNGASFMITDHLILNVVPTSVDTIFCLLKNLGIENMSSVEKMIVNVTKNQIMDLLKCSLLSMTTLTDVFLRKKLILEKYGFVSVPLTHSASKCSTQIIVKVTYQKSNGKVVCAEGKEDFADMLLSFLTFPLGGVVRLLKGNSSIGSIDGLYKSIVDLNDDYFMTKEVKDKLVDLRLAPLFKLSNLMIPFCELDAPTYFYDYSGDLDGEYSQDFYLTSTYKECSGYRTLKPLDVVDPMSKFAKGPKVYVVTDDLVVIPMSSISVTSLLNSVNTSISDLEEKVVTIGIKEGLNILKASLTSTSALTNGLGHLLVTVKEEK